MSGLGDDETQLRQQNDAQIQAIEDATKLQPLTDEPHPLSHLAAKAPNFQGGIAHLATKYSRYRPVRGDGNCYYRAFLYALVEQLLAEPKEKQKEFLEHTIQTVSWKETVLAAGYDAMAMEVFYECIVELLEDLPNLTPASFHATMNRENDTSDYCTWYLRAVTAAFLKNDPARFLPVCENNDVHAFCTKHVEPMGVECDQVQVLALAEALGVQVVVEYLDGHSETTVTAHTFGPPDPNNKAKLNLLFRPGHYDILYPIAGTTSKTS